MGHSVRFKINILLPNESYENNPSAIKDKIETLNSDIAEYETRLKMFASANPKDITPKDWDEEAIRWIEIQITEILEYMNDAIRERDNLETYLAYLEDQV